MKHFRTSFKGEKPVHEIQEAVGQEGGLVTRIHVEKGETHVYYAAEAAGEEFQKRLGASPAREVGEKEVSRVG